MWRGLTRSSIVFTAIVSCFKLSVHRVHLNNSLLQSGISKHSKYYSFIGREKNPEFLGPSIFLNEYEDASLGNNHILEQF